MWRTVCITNIIFDVSATHWRRVWMTEWRRVGRKVWRQVKRTVRNTMTVEDIV